jgi:SAM-dependent methyltransferase
MDMKSSQVKTLVGELIDVCTDVETSIAGKIDESAAAWALADAMRHAHTLGALVDIADAHEGQLSILNASGLYHGHQDFSLATALARRGVPFTWTTQESEDSPYLKNETMVGYLDALSIEVNLVDYRRPVKMPDHQFDVILFTEIAEHLDHTALLNALRALRSTLVDGGTLILTTPNLVSLPNRLRLLFGHGGQPFFGDGLANLEAGLYGHIAAYDIGRLTRLLADVGFVTTDSYTFDWGRAWKRGLLAEVVTVLSTLVPNAGQNVFLTATPGELKAIPFAT